MIQKKVLLLVLIIALPFKVSGALFSGKISDEKGRPVPYASVYIHELSTGVSADINGEFRISLKNGEYTCEVSSLGYKRERFTVKIDSGHYHRQIILKEEIYLLNDVTFKGRGEDRALSVMRRAIAKAPFHRQQVRSYESAVYTKGTMKITKIPAILKLQAGKKKTGLVLNKLFMIESGAEIIYNYPDNYLETIRAVSSTIPSEIDPGSMSGVIRASVYNREFFGKLSPLAPNAFNYYRFIYEGISNESDRIINKIRIVPKKGDSKLISGHIYIQDNIWNVSYLEFSTKEAGVTMDVKISFNEVKSSVMVPTAYSVDVKVDILGINADGRYNSSITYNKVSLAESAPELPAALSESKELSSKEAKKIAAKTERAIRDSEVKNPKRDLEIKRDTTHKRIVDTLAKVRDSVYWADVRRLPLSHEEQLAYKASDSLKQEFKRVFDEDSVRKINRSTGNKILDKIFYDARFKIGKKITFGYGGLTRVVGDFNFIDGYTIGQNLYASYRINNNVLLELSPEIYYSTERNRLLWKADALFSYSPLRGGRFYLSVGNKSSDISNNPGVSPMVNSYASFLFGLNPVKFFNNRWIFAENRIDLANGLRINSGIKYQESSPLENGDVKSLFGDIPGPNTPDNIYGADVEEHRSLSLAASLSYTPEYYYRIRNGKKLYIKSRYPTFNLYWRGSLISPENGFSNYGLAGFSVSQRFSVGLYGAVLYNLDIGGFYKRTRVFLTDYRHFAASGIMVSENGFSGAFNLLDSYRLSTPESWVTFSAEYRTDYLLLNRLSFLNSLFLYEALHFKTLWLPDKKISHTEAGYSFGIKGLARVGIFAGFDGIDFKSTAFRIELPILSQLK